MKKFTCDCVFLGLLLSGCVCRFHSSVLIIDPGLSSFIRGAVKWRDEGARRGTGDGAEVVIGPFHSLWPCSRSLRNKRWARLFPLPLFAHPFLLLGSFVTVDQSIGEPQRSRGANSV